MSATFEEKFEEAIQPLLDGYAALEADVAEKEAELAALREKRNRLKNAVRAIDPERLPKSNGHKPKAAKPKKYAPGKETVDYVRRFLLDTGLTGEFGSTKLVNDPDYHGAGASTLPAVLRQLHEEGLLRLVRKGKGASRYYEVIR